MYSWSLLHLVKQQDSELFGKTSERPQPIYWDPETAGQHDAQRSALSLSQGRHDFVSQLGVQDDRPGSYVLTWSRSEGFRIISNTEE
jgi:hypothetical protein